MESSPASPSPSTDPPSSAGASPSASVAQEPYRILETSYDESWGALKAAFSSTGHPELYDVSRSAILFRLCLIASFICNHTGRLEQFNEALESLRQALPLFPNSVSIAHTHASLLFEIARQKEAVLQEEAGSYEAVVQECERGLLIKNSADPIPFSASQLENLRKELVELTEKSKWKIIVLGGGNRRDKWKRLVDDNSLEEVKAEFETALRRKKEIAGWRPSLDDWLGEKRKLKKGEKKDVATIRRVRAFWNDKMSVEDKRKLFRIGIEDLNGYLEKNDLRMAMKVFTEALDFAKATNKWMFWACCCCEEKLCDLDSSDMHISLHLGPLSESFQSIMPIKAPKWAINGVWKPAESTSAAKIMERRSAAADWPYIDEKSERAEIIDRIRKKLQLFTSNGCLAWSHLNKLQSLIIELLQKHVPPESMITVTDDWLHQSLPLICFLEVPELNSVVEFLEDLAGVCQLGCTSEDEDDGDRGNKLLWITPQTIVLSCDKSTLLFDDRFLGGETDLVSWLWAEGPTTGEQINAWKSLIEASKSQAMEFYKIVEDECGRLRRMCERKREYLSYLKALENVENICAYDVSLLLKRWKELDTVTEDDDDDDNAELDMIWSIMKETEEESQVQMAIERLKNRLVRVLYQIDAIILSTLAAMRRQIRQPAGTACVFDYQFVVVPMLRSFIKACLEDLVNKDTAEVVNAAIKFLSAKYALGAKNTNKGERQGPGKSNKEKKKNDRGKAKPAGGSEEQLPFVSSEPNQDVGSTQQEEEIRGEYEEEQRKLEENLDLKRQIE
ncbi:uncharacterized protein LOC132163809 [Corylus avellana]|uniref:uncharacterized protein LOC132163809 n=1 Tax=Corylus avellana TaxID=13451 RepID=UPI00286CE283|nr:uncharacterized protein LOC132163809 [Corylus avellana]